MKTFSSFVIIGLAGSLGLGAMSVRADLEVSAAVSIHAQADFYEPLAGYGAWVEAGSYGRCWHPAQVEVGWRPYCYGHWVWTDCGWYWASDEPWGWACYHYGSWGFDSAYGWVWVPGIEWAPAWVSWRVGGGYIGWAPLAPRGVFFASVAVPSAFVFVETTRFVEPIRPTTVIINNTTIINQTTVLNNIRRESRKFDGAGPQKVVINEGPRTELIQKATGRSFKAVPIREAARQAPFPAAVQRRMGESMGKEKAHGMREPLNPAPERRSRPGEFSEPSSRMAPPDKNRPPSREEFGAPPERRNMPGGPPLMAPGPAEGRDKGREMDNSRGHEMGKGHEDRPPIPGAAPSRPPGPPEGRDKGREMDKGKGRGEDKGKGREKDPNLL